MVCQRSGTTRSGVSDSFMMSTTAVISMAPPASITQNRLRQLAMPSSCPPASGARIGARPMISISSDMARAASWVS
ncbi:Uncharacterised protein [Achromobacter sp. 2789STDY5608615]|nr:Uncharacterised protein [Achromobacter sp. 2789STDY5608615]